MIPATPHGVRYAWDPQLSSGEEGEGPRVPAVPPWSGDLAAFAHRPHAVGTSSAIPKRRRREGHHKDLDSHSPPRFAIALLATRRLLLN